MDNHKPEEVKRPFTILMMTVDKMLLTGHGENHCEVCATVKAIEDACADTMRPVEVLGVFEGHHKNLWPEIEKLMIAGGMSWLNKDEATKIMEENKKEFN